MAGGTGDTLIAGPWEHRKVVANGIRFHVTLGRREDLTRPLVLLVHGFGQFWWTWRHQLPVLDQAGYRVAALDLRGYGASDKTPHGYDPRTTATDVAGVVRSLGHRTAVLVGHGWGGMTAWDTAAHAPAQVAALATVAAPHPLAFPWRTTWRHLAFCQLPLLPEQRLMAANSTYLATLLGASTGPNGDQRDPEAARRYAQALHHWPSPQRALAYPRTFIRHRFGSTARDHRRALRRGVDVSVLSVHGRADPLVPLAAMTAGGEHTRGPHQVVDLPGVGHLPHEESPVAVNAALLDWLATLDLT